MSNISLKITKTYRYFFYMTMFVSLLSGSGFWLLRQYGFTEGDFGPESHFMQYPLLQLHGFAAFAMLMSLGAIFGSHIPKTWASKRSRTSGISILTSVSLSILSAYSLYYLVGEDWHELLGNGHAIIGLLSPVLLYVHIHFARKNSRYAQKRTLRARKSYKKVVR